MRKFWSEEDIKYITENYGKVSVSSIATYLERSYASILSMSRKLKIHKANINKSNKDSKSKKCTVCKIEYPKTGEFFTNFISKRNGLIFQTKCRECERNYIQKRNSTVEYVLRSIINGIKKDEKRKIKGFDIDYDFLLTLWEKQEHRCAISGIEMTTLKGKGVFFYSNLTVDKINASKGYTKDNVQLCCSWANVAKGNLSMEDFKKMVEVTFNNLENK